MVADLPEKEEITLYVEMEDSQRQLYDKHKTFYRERLMHTIEENGRQKSSISILAALLKLVENLITAEKSFFKSLQKVVYKSIAINLSVGW